MEIDTERDINVGFLLSLARYLKSEDGENPEYDRALCELIADAAGLSPGENRGDAARAIGVDPASLDPRPSVETYQLVRSYGDLEPTLIGEPFPALEEELAKAVVAHLKEEPYNDNDALFFANIRYGRIISFGTFSGGHMESLRRRAGEPVPA